MSFCWFKFVNQVNRLNKVNYPIAKVKTTVVVKKSPTAAVAVNSEKFILRIILKTLMTFF